jgi:choline dehydrogenase-like flavoprotein
VFLDARSLDDNSTISVDLCIIGAGAAGITIAREFAGLPIQVCLLEAGGLKPDRLTQNLAKGENVGRSYFRLDETRVYGFGGTTSVWNGTCRPLDAADFEPRAWVPHSGWPFTRQELDGFYAAAHDVLQLGAYDYNLHSGDGGPGQVLPLHPDRVETHLFRISPPVRFGRLFRRALHEAPNVLTLLHAHAIEIHLADSTASKAVAAHVRLATLGGRRATVSARWFAVACGGLENPRLLLSSNSTRPAGLGNEHGLVGRYFMEHPNLRGGRLEPHPGRRLDLRLYSIHPIGRHGQSTLVEGVLSIARPVLEERQMLRCSFLFPPLWRALPEFDTSGVNSARQLVRALRLWQVPYESQRHLGHMLLDVRSVVVSALRAVLQPVTRRRVLYPRSICEQAPDPESRVTLSTKRDALGRNQLQLDWRVSGREIETLRQGHQILAHEIQRAGVGRFESPLLGNTDEWTPRITGGYHHIGTTRMHHDPRQGVVNEHGRIHSLANVYVAGSSVFPTSGYANPTLTIVALALRLADHLKGHLTLS